MRVRLTFFTGPSVSDLFPLGPAPDHWKYIGFDAGIRDNSQVVYARLDMLVTTLPHILMNHSYTPRGDKLRRWRWTPQHSACAVQWPSEDLFCHF